MPQRESKNIKYMRNEQQKKEKSSPIKQFFFSENKKIMKKYTITSLPQNEIKKNLCNHNMLMCFLIKK